MPKASELRGVCQPPDLDVCIYRRLLTRRISIHFTRLFLAAGVSANGVSVMKGIIACIGSLLFIPGIPAFCLAGALLLQISFVLDASDGEVARFTGSCGSGRGEFVDKLGDTASRGLFYGAWGIALFNRTGQFIWLPLGMIMAGTWLVIRFCSVETVLESISAHSGTPLSRDESAAVERLFVKRPSSGRVEYLLSRFYHPWVNIALLASASSLSLPLFKGLFAAHAVAWLANAVRKTMQHLRICSFRRPSV